MEGPMAINIARRKFFVVLGSMAVAWPLAAQPQESRKLPIIGLLSLGASPTDPANFRPFLEQMRELGYVDQQNVIFDRRFAAGDDSLIRTYLKIAGRCRSDINGE
jgi:hypothetical protein